MAIQFLGDETQVNGTTAGNQRSAATAALGNGGYVTVWASDSGDGSGKAILGQLFAADGSKVGSEFLVNTTTDGDQDLPDVVFMPAANGPDAFFVVWQSAEAGGSVIRARRFLQDGTPVPFIYNQPADSPNTDVIVSGTLGGTKPAAGLYGSGRLAIVWEAPSGDGDGTAIAMAQYRFALGAPVVVNSTTAGNQVDPRVGSRGAGGLNVVWESQEPTGDVIRGKVILQAGSPASDVILSNAADEDESLPNVSNNGALAIWNSGTSIKAATVPFFSPASSAMVLNTTPGGMVSRSEVIGLTDGTYLAVYFTQSGDDGSGYSLRVERFGSSGESLSAEILVPDQFTGTQEAPSVVQLANGNVVISWASEAASPGNFEIKQRILNFDGPEVGDSGDNIINGTDNADTFYLQQGGNDTANGFGGNDVFVFGGTLTSADQVHGGFQTDQIVIQGDYSGANAVTLGSNVSGIENLAILPGNDTQFGDPGTNFYDYSIRVLNAAFALDRMVVDAGRLRVGEDFTFDGSSETDGSFFIYGGGGTDLIDASANNDVFLFGAAGQWGSSDVITGGAGIDQLALRGDYTVTFGAGQLAGVEQIALVSAYDTRFGALGDGYDYDLTMDDGNVTGTQMTVDGATLRSDETLSFNGSAEDDGSFRVFGGNGNDVIQGSQNGDIIVGRGRGDTLYGNGGNDVFRYNDVTDSNSTERDGIQDFNAGDLIDLSKIDANTLVGGNQAFSFIGNAAFSNTAGELRFENISLGGPIWLVQGDTDGNGVSDFEVVLVISPADPITSSDFIL